ncbi:MAG TPA: NAD-dependent deacylase [Aldersonia sp.]
MPLDVPFAILAKIRNAHRIVVSTGAGMSAESGVPTFRDAQTGLWERFDAESLATPQAWAADPALVWAWYQWRAHLVRSVQPNAGHRALARWARVADVAVVTQNVDDLHERAGSSVAAHLHGSLFAPRCSGCGEPAQVPDPLAVEVTHLPPPPCALCGAPVRPGVVWFGEELPYEPWRCAVAAVEACDLLLVVGTSSIVYPAAGLPALARAAGAAVVEINPQPTDLTDQVDHSWQTTAAIGLPALVAQLL